MVSGAVENFAGVKREESFQPIQAGEAGREIQQPMRLLLIEDEEKISRLIVRGLTAERFAVDAAAADGSSGLELAQAYTYDLIILA
jgi:ActR/RegA family two-component response regulator